MGSISDWERSQGEIFVRAIFNFYHFLYACYTLIKSISLKQIIIYCNYNFNNIANLNKNSACIAESHRQYIQSIITLNTNWPYSYLCCNADIDFYILLENFWIQRSLISNLDKIAFLDWGKKSITFVFYMAT